MNLPAMSWPFLLVQNLMRQQKHPKFPFQFKHKRNQILNDLPHHLQKIR